ncbi:MAG: sodium:proton antiporter, partial [Rhodomicrobium sp.]
MTPFQIIAVIVTLSAFGAYINARYVKLPATIGVMVFAFALSLAMLAAGKFGLVDFSAYRLLVEQIDFSDVLFHGILSFLLLAGAMHINLDDLRSVRWSVALRASLGVLIASFVTGTLFWYASGLAGLQLPYIYALLFGTLISPTDPIAVLSILKEAGIPKSIHTKIAAESLFNDGAGVVAFITVLSVATRPEQPDVLEVAGLFIRQALGGAALGLVCGWFVYRLFRTVDDYKVEMLLTLALATGGYALAEELDVSAPIFIVTAGLIIGNQGRELGMSVENKGRLDVFWEVVDEVLNAALFILIGLEIAVISIHSQNVILGLLAVAAALIGRFVSIGLPVAVAGFFAKAERGTIAVSIWGGLRGGLSVAMALSLPPGPYKEIILPATYIVVLFSILVQGL